MNSIKNYFSSPLKQAVTVEIDSEKTPENLNGDTKVPKATFENSVEDRNKKIFFNMTSVLKSISKTEKHRHKKKCTKRDKSPTKEDEVGQAEVSKSEKLKSKRKAKPHKKRRISTESDILPIDSIPVAVDVSPPNEKNEKENKVENMSPKKNIFQIMMNSRNKSLGTNSPGKLQMDVATPETEPQPENSKAAETKKERTKLLEEWANKKGGLKRRLDDEAQEKYAEKVLDRRAKRLKKSLTQPGSEKSTPKNGVDIEAAPSLVVVEKRPVKGKSVDPKSIKDDFVKVLNSPIKKRDSLLGYFPKMNKTPDLEEEAAKTNEGIVVIIDEVKEEETPRRGRRKKIKTKFLDYDVFDTPPAADVELVEAGQSTPGGRPRRACASKIVSYDIFDQSPPKNDKIGRKRVATENGTRSRKNIDDDDDFAMIPSNVKLAPLFMKPTPKPFVDPVVLKAKQDFLMSGIPEKMRNEIEKQKVFEDHILNDAPIFPLVSHIQQFDSTEDSEEEAQVKLRADEKEMENSCEKLTLGAFTELVPENLKWSNGDRVKIVTVYPRNGCSIEIVKLFLKQLKENYGNFPTNRCYRFLNAKSSKAEQPTQENGPTISKQKSRKSKLSPLKAALDADDSVIIVEDSKPTFSALNGGQLFTETYKPASSEEFVINPTPIEKLKAFLTTWQSSLAPKTNGYDSSTDFLASDSNSQMSMGSSSQGNSIVLCGPSSCGKTSSVYALANELNFNVLEVNAGNKRTGKKLLQELLEATQSHQVRNNEDTKVGEKKKAISAKFLTAQDSQTGEGNGQKKKSLILIEDADLVFDVDFGFIDAINQLVTISKRPVIITSNSVTCDHLLRHIEQNRIEYTSCGCVSMSKWLSIMCLVENAPMDYEIIQKLYVYNRLDLRRTMMELQFYVQSGGDRKNRPKKSKQVEKHDGLYDFYTKNQNKTNVRNDTYDFETLWCNMGTIVGQPVVAKGSTEESTALDDLVFCYNNFAVAERIRSRDVQDKLVECVNDEISQELVAGTLKHCEQRFQYQPDKYDVLKRPMETIEPLELADCILPSRHSRLDYQPLVRNICRSEKLRGETERKRSRFHHYMRNVVETNSFSNNDYDIHCDILWDVELIESEVMID